MRSKSELIIADRLFSKQIDYQYEQPLDMPDGTRRLPDFTVIDDTTGTTYYWEHLGMLQRPSYRRKWQPKLAWYRSHGILPHDEGGGPNGTLIITQDGDDGSISSPQIQTLIDELFTLSAVTMRQELTTERSGPDLALRTSDEPVLGRIPDLDRYSLSGSGYDGALTAPLRWTARSSGHLVPAIRQVRVEPLKPADPAELGGIVLRGRLGRGGMGTVYYGITPDGEPVAVKVIREDLVEKSEARGRFDREALAIGMVQGPRVANLITTSRPDENRQWFAVEYVRGLTLSEYVTEYGALPAELGAALGIGLAEALAAIHEAGILHRDLKPSNILLGKDGPKVIDFGLAALTATPGDLTRTDETIGTPVCMSPEQVNSAKDLTTAADVYSLGAVLCSRSPRTTHTSARRCRPRCTRSPTQPRHPTWPASLKSSSVPSRHARPRACRPPGPQRGDRCADQGAGAIRSAASGGWPKPPSGNAHRPAARRSAQGAAAEAAAGPARAERAGPAGADNLRRDYARDAPF